MKKVLALLIAAMMIVSMIPVMAITTSAADVPGDWDTYRSAGDYEEPDPGEEESYKAAPGYEYTSEGFHMISADYTGTTPFGTIQSKEPVSVQDGVYMELRVDQYPYGGEAGTADHWISFHIWDSQKIAPGNVTDYGQGWLSLCRTPGEGGAGSAQSFVSKNEGAGQFWHQGDVAITPELDANGKEIYTFEVSYDGTNYTVSVCGVPVQGTANITNHLNSIDPNGEFYVGVTFHSGAADGKIEATMLKYGTSADNASTPIGSDSKEPEENILVTAPIADPSTIETNQPALLFDANETSWSGTLATQGMTLAPQGNGSFKVEATEAVGFHQWGIGRKYSYDAKDFPVVAILIEDPNQIFDNGTLRYSAGKNMSADDVHTIGFTPYDDSCRYYGEDEEYYLMFVDFQAQLDAAAFEEGWNGRINGLRFDYSGLYLEGDPEVDYFYFHFSGVFRSIEEATVYSENYLRSLDVEVPEDGDVVDPGDDPEVNTGDEQETTAGGDEQETTAGGDEQETTAGGNEQESTAGGNEQDTTASGEKDTTKTEDKTEADGTAADGTTAGTDAATEGGCASVIGSVAVLLTAAAAAVVLKKRD